MSTTIDSRVVEAKFDGNAFERGVSNVLSALGRLKAGLKLDGATKGINDVQVSANKFNMAGMANAATTVGSSFSAMSVVAVTALATVVNKAVTAGGEIAKSLTIAPVMEGFREYELKLNSIQTILANTKASGATLNDVSTTLKELNEYSDKTIYNFGQMAKNIGTFTAAGVDLETATSSIKGIANLAALSGSSSEQASTAMYQLSQAISSGKVSLMDWNSVVNAGMGGSVFQRALAETAVAMGTLESGALKLEGPMQNVKIAGASFRDSISAANGGPTWLTSEVLTTALGTFTGDMTDAQLAAEGFSAAQIKSIQDTAKTAKDAATIVKTGTQLMGTLKESAASGWAETWEILIGDFEEAKTLWTGASNVFGGMIQASADARNKVLADFKALGGRDVLIQSFKNAFQGVMSILKPIKEAFREIFPAKTGQDLLNMAKSIESFTERLKIGEDTANNVKRTFAGFFAIFSIVGQVIGGAITALGNLFSTLGKGSGGFLNFTGGVGDFLVSLDEMLRKSGLVVSFFNGIAEVLKIPLQLLGGLGAIVGSLFTGFDSGGAAQVSDAIDGIGKRLDPLARAADRVRSFFAGLVRILNKVGSVIGDAMSQVGDAIAGAFSSDNFGKTLDVINTGLLAGIILLLKNFFKGGMGEVDFTGGLFDGIKESLGAVTGAMEAMQQQVKADVILKIAGALALLTASILVLSLIDPKKLQTALLGLGAGIIGMEVALVALTSAIGYMGALKLPLLVASLIGLAGALLLLSVAIKIMSTIKGEDLTRGIIGIGAALLTIAIAMRAMPKNMIAQAAALAILSLALIGLATAIKLFATITWEQMSRGLSALASALVAIGLAMRAMPKGMLLQAVALLVLSVALNAIAASIKLFASISWDEMARGIAALAAALGTIAIAMRLMPSNMLLQAAALVAVSVALNLIAVAVKSMGGMSWEEIGKGMVTLGGSLLILAAGLNLMNGTISGAIALGIATAALMLLTPVLITLGNLDMQTIATGLGALAGIFVILGVAGYALAPVVPVIVALAGAMVLVGAGLALAGLGVTAFAAAFVAVVATGAAGINILAGMLGTFVNAIPAAMAAFGRGVVAFASAIAAGGPAFFRAFSAIIGAILDAITKNAPKAGRAFQAMLDLILGTLVKSIPKIANAGLQIILRLLSVMAANVGRIVTVATTLIVNFLNAVSANLPRVIQAGVNLIIAFVNGVANAIRRNSAPLVAAGINLGSAIIEGMLKGITSGIGAVTAAAGRIAKAALGAAKSILGIKSPSKEFEKVGKFTVEGLVKGFDGNKEKIQEAYNTLGSLLAESLKQVDEQVKKSTARIAELDGKRIETIQNAQDRLNKLRAAKKKDTSAIAKAQRDLNEAQKPTNKAMREEIALLERAKTERYRLRVATQNHTVSMGHEMNALKKLAEEYDVLDEKVKEAEKGLVDATKTRDDYQKSLATQFSNLPDVTKDTKLGAYMEDLQKKVIETQNFSTAIQKLRDLGLNDTMYKELLAKGPEANPFLAELIGGGKGAVNAVNALGAQLDASANKIGASASVSLYQAGVDAAKGLLDGVVSQRSALNAQMDKIAGDMIAAFKKKLGIKSPSKEFEKVGGFSIAGLAKGLRDTTAITSAADAVGNDALAALRSSMSGLSLAINDNMDLTPTITPVLDLSGVKKSAQSLGQLLPSHAISVDSAYSKAKDASKSYNDNRNAVSDGPVAAETVNNMTYVQNNNSPKALSSAEIYRQTKSQLSTVKGALTT